MNATEVFFETDSESFLTVIPKGRARDECEFIVTSIDPEDS